MAEVDLLNHYGLQSLNPTRWPEGLFEEGDQERDTQWKSTAKARKRMTTLGRIPSLQSQGRSQKASVQKDEPDPLGTSQSVVASLRRRGLPVEDDYKLRNTFLLSSVTFNPSRYLAEVHSGASTDDLIRGLDFLSTSIEQKSASLKVLVESNFERFLRAKATIDNVYKEMRDHGTGTEDHLKLPHSRQSSRNNPHFRSTSGTIKGPQSPQSPQGRAANISEKRRYALSKESDYGTLGVRLPLLEAATKADEIWGPAMGDKGKEEKLKSVLDTIDKNRNLFDHAAAIDDAVRRSDYETMVDEHSKVEKYARDAQALGQKAQQSAQPLSDGDLSQMIITSRVWLDVQSSMESVKRNVWNKLLTSHDSPMTKVSSHRSDEPMELMAVLLQLGVSENPISAWLQAHQDHLHYKITSTFERFRVELEIMRRRLVQNGKPSQKSLASHLKTALNTKTQNEALDMDSLQVLRYWEKVETALEAFLSTKTGILGEVIEFWDTAQAFIDGRRQRSLPVGADGQARRHHRLNSETVSSLQQAPAKLCGLIRDQLHKFFLQEPVQDVSSLFSPMPPTPISPNSPSSGVTPSRLIKFNFRTEEIPPPSLKIGEAWESLAFWPPYSTSLSASTVLSRVLVTVASAAGEIATINIVKQDENQTSALRILISDIRERFNAAICAAWVTDSEHCRELEDWTKAVEKPDVTNMPAYFSAWQSTMLTNLQKIVYISDATGGVTSSSGVIVPPSARHVETVQRAFRNTLYKAFDGMMQYSRKPVDSTDGVIADRAATAPSLSSESANPSARSTSISAGASNMNVRKLLTISNFQQLRSHTVPTLVSLFESHFSTTISADLRVLRESLSQMSGNLFKGYVKPTLQHIDGLIHAGISAPNYTTSNGSRKPDNAKPYVSETLGCLVVLHTEVSATTPGLTHQVLSHCLEHISSTLVDAFTQKQGMSTFSRSHSLQALTYQAPSHYPHSPKQLSMSNFSHRP